MTHFTYTVAILVEGQGPVPGVQMYSYNRALAKLRGELHFVTFVLQKTCPEDYRMSLLKRFISLLTAVEELFKLGLTVDGCRPPV